MKLRELIDALAKAPPEALNSDVLMSPDGKLCNGIHLVEAIRFKNMSGRKIGPWTVVVASLGLERAIPRPDSRRMYLSDISKCSIRKGKR